MVKQIVVEKPFLNYGHLVGESPLYNKQNHSLSWICTIKREIHRIFLLPNSHEIDVYSPEQTAEVEKGHLVIIAPDNLGTIQLTEDPNILIVAAKKGFGLADFSKLTFSYINEFFDEETNKLNDGIIDFNGDFFIGSMEEKIEVPFSKKNKLRKVHHADFSVEIVADGVGMSNGLSFNSTKDSLFYIDTTSYHLWKFDYDAKTGVASNKQPYINIGNFLPAQQSPAMDGFCMNDQDEFYVAIWGHSKILHFNKEGTEILEEIVLPAQRVTCPGFAGIHKNELFITTAHPLLPFPDFFDKEREDLGGAIFRVKLDGVQGNIKDNIWGGKI